MDTITSFLSCLWNNINELIALIMLIITGYAIWLRYGSNDIQVYIVGYNHCSMKGNRLKILISNRTLSVKTISLIHVKLFNNKLILFSEFEEPLFLEPFKYYTIDSNYKSALFDLSFYLETKEYNFVFTTPTGKKIIKSVRKSCLDIIKSDLKSFINDIIEPKEDIVVTENSAMYDGKVISNMVRYIVEINFEDGSKEVFFVNMNGLCYLYTDIDNEVIPSYKFFGYDTISNELLRDERKFDDFLRTEGEKHNFQFEILIYSNWEVTHKDIVNKSRSFEEIKKKWKF